MCDGLVLSGCLIEAAVKIFQNLRLILFNICATVCSIEVKDFHFEGFTTECRQIKSFKILLSIKSSKTKAARKIIKVISELKELEIFGIF